jgi:hypothetical protein
MYVLASEADTPRSDEQLDTETCRPGFAGGCDELDVPVEIGRASCRERVSCCV